MGIYIKGITMPKNCMECPFSDHEAWCLIPGDSKQRYYCPTKEISEHCPLAEVQEPHGRLIDADALLALWSGCEVSGSINPLIDARPTVIEAEGE